MAALIKSPRLIEQALDLLLQPRTNEVENRLTGKSSALVAQVPEASLVPPSTTIAPSGHHGDGISTAEPIRDEIKAQSQLDDLLRARQLALQEAEAKAVADGFTKGLAEGKAKGEAGYYEAIKALGQALLEARAAIPKVLWEAEQLIAPVVFEAVCKIVGPQLSTPEGCEAIVRQVLARASDEEHISVRVSPKTYRLLSEYFGKNNGEALSVAEIPMEGDDNVELGGCILTLREGSVDGRIETQFRNFAQSLKDAGKTK